MSLVANLVAGSNCTNSDANDELQEPMFRDYETGEVEVN